MLTKARLFLFVFLLWLSVIEAALVTAQTQRRADISAGRALKLRQLPASVRRYFEQRTSSLEFRVTPQDLNRDNRDELIIRDTGVLAQGEELRINRQRTPRSSPVPKAEQKVWVFARLGAEWQPVLEGIEDSKLRFVPAQEKGRYGEFEYTDQYEILSAPSDANMRGQYVIKLRWNENRYRVCSCRRATDEAIVDCQLLGSPLPITKQFELLPDCR